MKRFFLFVALLFAAIQPATAQTWDGPGEQPIVYPVIDDAGDLTALSNNTIPVLGDGSTFWGGTPPGYSLQPANIENPVSLTGHVIAGGGVAGSENKWRTVCNGNGLLGYIDPIRGFNIEPFGHLHNFYGGANPTKISTGSTARAQTDPSICPGENLNNTYYWFTALVHPNALGNGVTMVKKIDSVIVYYVCPDDPSPPTRCLGFPPRGMAFIGGTNVDDPDEIDRLAQIAAANAANGPGYQAYERTIVATGPNTTASGPQRPKIICIDTGNYSTGFTTAAGADALSNCPSTSQISIEVNMPTCWDGENLTSPTGYKHVIPGIRDGNSGVSGICPTGSYIFATVEVKLLISHQGVADYTQITCTADGAMAAVLGRAVGHCESFHVDWMNGMDQRIADQINQFCLAAMNSPDYFGACDNSTINDTPERLDSSGIDTGQRYYGDEAGDWRALPAVPSSGKPARIRFKMGSSDNHANDNVAAFDLAALAGSRRVRTGS